MKRLIFIFLLTAAACGAQTFNYPADHYGGLLAVPCSGHPHKMTITSASQSTTTAIVTVAALPAVGVAVNEPMRIAGTSTALDWTYTANSTTDGMGYVTAINVGTKTITLTMPASNTVGTVSTGTISPGHHYIQTLSTPFGSGPQYCTPEDHWVWTETVGAACANNICEGAAGVTISLATKYGSACLAAQELQIEFISMYNFQGVGQASDAPYDPSVYGSCPSNPKVTNSVNAGVGAYYAVNLGGYASQQAMNLNDMVNYTYYNVIGGSDAPLIDYFNPNWASFIQLFLLNFNSSDNSFYRSPRYQEIDGDDTDYTKLPDAGPYFHTYAAGFQASDPAMEVLVSSPLETLSNEAGYGGGVQPPYVFAYPINFSKTPAVSPPATCSVTTICTLYDFLHKEYTTIAALNTAWGTSTYYTTFGTSGACYGYSYSWCASTAALESYGTGSGATTYTHNFSHTTVSQHSVQILLNGIVIGGDCPYNVHGCTSTSGNGALMGPGTWVGSNGYPTNALRTDSNGNIEYTTTGGQAGGATPAWPGTCTGTQTTSDGSITWTCLGPGISSGTIDYSSGAASITFNHALASGSIGVNYIANGWCLGTGVLDECGANTTWVGSNYVCIVEPPAFQTTHAYTVNQEIYDSMSGTWQIVTTAGTSAGSAPSFSTTQGNTVTSGGVTFESLGLPVCGSEMGSDYGAVNADATLGADMTTWLGQESGAYFGGVRTALNAAYPDWLYEGADDVGVWQNPPRPGVLLAAQQYTDAIFTQASLMDVTIDPQSLVKYSFTTQYYQKPLRLFEDPVSSQSLHGTGGNYPAYASQAARGQGWYRIISSMLNTLSFNGTLQWAGINWWGSHPFQNSDFGFNSSLDNPYNSHDDVSATLACYSLLSAYTCGGEIPASSWLGANMLVGTGATLPNANLLWTQGTPTPPATPGPQPVFFSREKP